MMNLEKYIIVSDKKLVRSCKRIVIILKTPSLTDPEYFKRTVRRVNRQKSDKVHAGKANISIELARKLTRPQFY